MIGVNQELFDFLLKIKVNGKHAHTEDSAEKLLKTISSAPCILCGRKPVGIGTYIPYSPREFGAPIGKDRFFLYPACEKCSSESFNEIEKKILHENGIFQ